MVRIAPVAPTGWPSAMAPPFGLTLRRIEAEPAADRQRLRGEGLVRLDHVEVLDRQAEPLAAACCTAGTGPMPMTSGRTPAWA